MSPSAEASIVLMEDERLYAAITAQEHNGGRELIVSSWAKQGPTEFDPVTKDVRGTDISFIPRYPGTQRVDSMDQEELDFHVATYTTSDAPEVVADFYRDRMPQFGWRQVRELEFQAAIDEIIELAPQMASLREQPGLESATGTVFNFSGEHGGCLMTVVSAPGERTYITVIRHGMKLANLMSRPAQAKP